MQYFKSKLCEIQPKIRIKSYILRTPAYVSELHPRTVFAK